MKLIHVWGTMYEMGYAQGTLVKDDLVEFLNDVWAYIESEVTAVFPKWFPKKLATEIANFAASTVLDLTHYITAPFTN